MLDKARRAHHRAPIMFHPPEAAFGLPPVAVSVPPRVGRSRPGRCLGRPAGDVVSTSDRGQVVNRKGRDGRQRSGIDDAASDADTVKRGARVWGRWMAKWR